MRGVCSVLTTVCLCVAGMAGGEACERQTVSIRATFDPTITSTTLQTIAKEEMAAIWRDQGVDVEWFDGDPSTVPDVDIVVERARKTNTALTVLGRATILDSMARGPIRISYDAVDALLDGRASVTTSWHERVVGRAIGRVMAHELGHVLLGSPGYHDPEGLMRATFVPDDLARPERSRFRLAPFSVERLQKRMACGGGL